jgi:hypothetical protein
MASSVPVEVLLARRPAVAGVSAFGHVNVSLAGRAGLERILLEALGGVRQRAEIPYHPDDLLDDHEVMVVALNGFDALFQQNASWSLERAVDELRRPKMPTPLDESGIRHGRWSFYVVRAALDGADVILVRAKSPTYGLGTDKFVTALFGTQLKPVAEPLIAFDHSADLMVVGSKVYVLSPRPIERLFIDADAIKARAPQIASSFASKVSAALTSKTIDAIETVISKNANVGRRVERLTRDGALARVTAAEVRGALPDAGLPEDAFGASGPLQAVTDGFATVLIDIAADLYYQPRFDNAPRRVAAYRKVS